ncbi:MAG: tRNA (adenosine(37)-N6)-threonylcarbamoyltransferase complex transferase subunit TsaD [Pyrinomonadaceae bacterium MAG19_C2-C3]|nr:tRNA (adenosine(37)-N6)-threonylcarbamoyltransferase complex transferase subunit TsaD [Pyrinomonadaceae bacterium MAG19_C2-C3]
MLVLGIESSCDETAAAVVEDGTRLRSSIINSQTAIHTSFGGVVPEIASREHLNRIVEVVDLAFTKANIEQEDLDGIAVTTGPGLIGSLLVGVSFAKAFGYALGLPFVGVNHIEGHIYSVAFDNPPVEYPALALIVSGGHTNLFYVPAPGRYKVVSRTRDDAAGEAFDKVAKMLGLGYPGGSLIERLARSGDASAIRFSVAQMSDGRPDFSFSGLKTAVAKYMRAADMRALEPDEEPSQAVKDLAASFQATVIRSLIETTGRMADMHQPRTLIVAGGVACNESLRDAASSLAASRGIPLYLPSRHLSTDNAAMIAAAGSVRLAVGERDGLDLNADVTLRLQNYDVEDENLRGRVHYRL